MSARPRKVREPLQLHLRAAQADVALDDLDDVGLLLHGLGKVAHCKVCSKHKAAARSLDVETVEPKATSISLSPI